MSTTPTTEPPYCNIAPPPCIEWPPLPPTYAAPQPVPALWDASVALLTVLCVVAGMIRLRRTK